MLGDGRKMASLLAVNGVKRSFGKLRALDGVTLNVEETTVTILIGPNGSGKTTLINVVTGFQKPDEGHIHYGPTEITGWSPQRVYRMGIARTFQIPSMFGKLTALENLLVAEKNHPGESFTKSLIKKLWAKHETAAVEKASKILELLGLSEQRDKPASLLSGGQMKLIEIGRALMSDANLYLLDEPVSGVNPTLAHEIFARIIGLRERYGITFLIVEHRLDIALKYVDYVNAMASGRLIAAGPPEQVVKDPKVIEAYLGA
jgi:branched-chain amino acid transport system ATP-binding protein